MAISDITEALALKESQNPQMEYNWVVTLPSIGSQGMSIQHRDVVTNSADGRTSGILNSPSVNPKEISHRVYSVELPNRSFESSKNIEKGHFWYGAFGSDIGTISLTVDEYEDGLTFKYFDEWMTLLQNEDGSSNPPALYKRNIIHSRLDSGLNTSGTSTYVGYFPTEITPVSWSYDGTNVLQYSIVLTGDSVERS